MPVLDHISFEVDFPQLLRRLRVREGSANVRELEAMVAEAAAVARPKALYRLAFVEEKGDDFLVVDGRKFTSRVLRVNLDAVQRVFVFIATSGHELEEWATAGEHDIIRRYWAEAINEMGVHCAATALSRHLSNQYAIEKTATMNPGSLADWPLSEQRVLFALLGDAEDAIGVQLTSSLLMVPTKSVSGIIYPTAETFASCQLCPRRGCPNRRAAYDPQLFEQKYRQATA